MSNYLDETVRFQFAREVKTRNERLHGAALFVTLALNTLAKKFSFWLWLGEIYRH